MGLTRTEPTELVEAQELHLDIAHLQEALADILQVRILQALQDPVAGSRFQELRRTEAQVIAAQEAETVIQPVNPQEVQVAGLTEALAAVALKVLDRQQEAQAVDLLDLPVLRHLVEVVVEITKFNNFLKFKILL